MLIYGILLTLTGLSMALWPTRRTDAVEKRILEGDDSFFEEQRSYRAYPFLRDPQWVRRVGVLTVIGGILMCLLTLYRR